MQSKFELHHIQRAVLLSLAHDAPQRFTKLQPPRIPNNTFSYHLKQLVSGGFIESTTNGYIPTRKALKLIGFGSTGQRRNPAPVMVTMLYVTNNDGEVLLLNRNKHPYQGWYGLPSGSVHLGESLGEAAKRELGEKTTIIPNEPLKQVGILDFQYREDTTDDIFVHAIAFVYSYNYTGDASKLNNITTEYGQLSWSKLGRQHILPEVMAVKELAEFGLYMHRSVQFVEPSHMPILQIG